MIYVICPSHDRQNHGQLGPDEHLIMQSSWTVGVVNLVRMRI